MNKIELALEYTDLLAETLKDNLVSAFLYGSVARGTDAQESAIDIYSIVGNNPDKTSLMSLGRVGRWGLIHGDEDFPLVSCTIKTMDRFIYELNAGLPVEAHFPLKESMILYDQDFVKGLKEKVTSGEIPLCPLPWSYYLYHGDDRLCCFYLSLNNGNLEDMKDDLIAAATYYLQAYLNYRHGIFVISKSDLLSRIKEECEQTAGLYAHILKNDSSQMDLGPIRSIKGWALERILDRMP